ADYNMIQTGDKVLVCLSGGKDSYTMVNLLRILRLRSNNKFEMSVFTLDQSQPGWDDSGMRAWLDETKLNYNIIKEDTYSIVKEKVPEEKTYCSLCSRLRRGIIYSYAANNGYTKIALGHHRDDLTTSLLMSILYNGHVQSMPPKLLSDDKKHIIIRPLVYCQESDISLYAQLKQFPIIPCNLCGSQENLMRKKIKKLIQELAKDHKSVPSSILRSLGNVKPSQLMDKTLWDFVNLEESRE
ncbi:MAG: tRNA 2-thiocytidine(32) synthetase TtcA, partial [Coxiellaceae bacterium]|nr:tRNA 2-thiocytidine(32) synthetase TtcA [Coxiellaceae bacterium]